MSMTTKNAKIEPEKHLGTVEIFPAFIGRHERNLLEDMGWDHGIEVELKKRILP